MLLPYTHLSGKQGVASVRNDAFIESHAFTASRQCAGSYVG